MSRALCLSLVVLVAVACASEDDGYGPLFTGATNPEAGSAGDGDGDGTSTGDGDGDGDPTTTGDGDGDPTTTGDGDGDGDGDPDPCAVQPNDGMCLACGKVNCCAQLLACVADADCNCVKDCFLGGDTVANCGMMCGVQPNMNAAFMAVGACVQNSCAAECL